MRKSFGRSMLVAVATVAVTLGVALGLPAVRGHHQASATTPTTRLALLVGGQSYAFDELTGITSEVEPNRYVFFTNGHLTKIKQYGKTKPPTVTLKGRMSPDLLLWAWHEQAVAGKPGA